MSLQKVRIRGQRSRSQRSKEVCAQFGHFQIVTPVWIQRWQQMMHKFWRGIEEVLYCFSRSSVKFWGHTGPKMPILTQIDHFQNATPVWIYLTLQYDAQCLKGHRRGALLLLKIIHQFQGHTGQEIDNFEPNWTLPECNHHLNSQMATNGA